MFRICGVRKIASLVSRNIRPVVNINQINEIANTALWRHVLTNQTTRLLYTNYCNRGVLRHISSNDTQRFYSKGGTGNKGGKKCDDEPDGCKLKPVECKPREKNLCKKPNDECEKKVMPALQECSRPNLMSDCPRPDCPWDDSCKKDNKNLLIFGLLLAAAAIGALMWLLSRGEPKKQEGAKPLKAGVAKKVKRPRQINKIPAHSKDIPREVPYLLIGGGTAAFAAFRAIKSNDPTAKVLVVSNEDEYPYMRPPLSKEMWFNDDPAAIKKLDFKQWNGSQRSLFYEPEDFYLKTKDLLVSENGGVAVARGWTITHIDVVDKKAYLDDGTTIEYEKCLIATGSLPKNLDIFESAPNDVINRTSVFRNVADFQCMHEKIAEAKSIAIIGGGFLGSELACAFGRKAKAEPNKFRCFQIFKEGGHMHNVLPEYLSFWTTEKIKREGVEVLSNAEVTGVSATEDHVTLVLSSGKSVTADLVIVAVGATPNTDMAGKSDLETDPDLGGYLVNTELQARSNLYVAGDAACFYDPRLGRRRIEHHDNAVISGRLAGENMTGAGKPYLHQSMFWSDLGGDVGYEAIGIVSSALPTVGVFAKPKSDDDKVVEAEAVEKEDFIPDQCLRFVGKEEEEKDKKKRLEKDAKAKAREEQLEAEKKRKEAAKPMPGEDFSKGVVFYLKDDIIVGIVLWNVFNRMSVARQVIQDQRKYEDLNEVAKLFNIHEE